MMMYMNVLHQYRSPCITTALPTNFMLASYAMQDLSPSPQYVIARAALGAMARVAINLAMEQRDDVRAAVRKVLTVYAGPVGTGASSHRDNNSLSVYRTLNCGTCADDAP
jgi:hypothetical protein